MSMSMVHEHGTQEVSGTTEAQEVARDMGLSGYTLYHRGRRGARSMKRSEFIRECGGNSYVFIGGGVVEGFQNA
jgi:hypothetical protein